jgi:hypothetical protein
MKVIENLPDFLSKFLGGIQTSDFDPFWLVDADAIQYRRKLVTIFSIINLARIGTKDVNSTLFQPQGDILWKLTCIMKKNI